MGSTKTTILKGYKVSCADDDHGATITFAPSSKEADRYANSDRCDCEFIRKTIRRAPAFDKYAPGPVTVANYLAEGWYWECGNCGLYVYGDQDGRVITDSNAYCDRNCLEKSLADYRALGPEAHESILAAVASMERWLAQTPLPNY